MPNWVEPPLPAATALIIRSISTPAFSPSAMASPVAAMCTATGEAMALALKTGVDIDLLIKAVAAGSGGSTQFGIRAPMMAQERFLPAMGTAATISHYFDLIGDLADRAGVATPMLDRAAELYARCIDMGLGEHECSEVINEMPRAKKRAKTKAKTKVEVERRARRSKRKQSRENNAGPQNRARQMPDLDKQAAYYTDILAFNLVAKEKKTRSFSPIPSIIIPSCYARANRPNARASVFGSRSRTLGQFEKQTQKHGVKTSAKRYPRAVHRRQAACVRRSEEGATIEVFKRPESRTRNSRPRAWCRTSWACRVPLRGREGGQQVLCRRARLR